MAQLRYTVVQGRLIVRNAHTQTHPSTAPLKSALLMAECLVYSLYRLTLSTNFGAVLQPFFFTVRHAVPGEGRQDRNLRPWETARSHRATLSAMTSGHSVDPVAKVKGNGRDVSASSSFESTI